MTVNQSETLSVIKVGGAVLENEASLSAFLDRFVAIPGLKILVHGGGRAATKLSEKLGIESKLVEGRRITDADTLEIVTMVYGGLVNKKTVAALQSKGCNAAGFTGADMNLITAQKRPVQDIDYGFVGDITQMNQEAFSNLLKDGITPVIAPIAVAMAGLYEVSLVFCFEKSGVLSDTDDEKSVIPNLTTETYQSYKEKGIIHSGMIPKIDNSFDALHKGVKQVIITSATTLDIKTGTHISL